MSSVQDLAEAPRQIGLADTFRREVVAALRLLDGVLAERRDRVLMPVLFRFAPAGTDTRSGESGGGWEIAISVAASGLETVERAAPAAKADRIDDGR